MRSLLIKDTTREEREEIVRKALWGGCGAECEFCSGCDNMGGGGSTASTSPISTGKRRSPRSTPNTVPPSCDNSQGQVKFSEYSLKIRFQG